MNLRTVSLILIQLILMSSGETQLEVWLTLNAQIDSIDFLQTVPDIRTERRIVLNWCHAPLNSTYDWIGLINGDFISVDNPILKIYVNGTTHGFHRTNHQIMNLDFSSDYLTNGCLKTNGNNWHIVYVSSNQIIATNCFKTNPFWMENSLELIGNKRLEQIAIPGTHNAGCYNKYGINNIPTKSVFLFAQDETIFDQLVYGIRYFDIRINFDQTDPESLQVVHNHWVCNHSVRHVLKQVRDFLEITTKEIIIFDIHSLSGFTDFFGDVLYERHEKLIQLIQEIVGNFIIPESYNNKTIKEMINSNKRLVIGYADKPYLVNMTESELFWKKVIHLWPNHNTVEGIERYFDRKLCSDQSKHLRSAMAQMTPTVQEILFNWEPDYGLRQRADDVNPKFKQWFWHKWWNCINIVSADYFLGSNVVEIAVKVNQKRFSLNASKFDFD